MNLLIDTDIARLKQRYTVPAFAQAVAGLRATADTQMNRPLDVPDDGGGWTHNYTCPTHATRLTYDRDQPHAHICDVDGAVFSGGVYDEAWRSFRNSELIQSAYAAALVWRMSDEQAYCDHTAQVLAEYAKRYANYPVHGKNAGQGRVMGQSLDEAVWSIPAAWAFDLIRDALPDDQRQLIQSQLITGLADHLMTQLWTRIHNIQCWHLAGLATLSVVLDDAQYMQPVFDPQWGVVEQIKTGVLEDGWWWEGSPHYHFYTAGALTSLGIAVRYTHPELLDNPRLKRMFTAPLDMLRPDLSLPSFNDGWFNITPAGGIAQYVQVFERVHSFWADPAHAQVMATIYDQYATRDSADALLFGPDALPGPTLPDVQTSLHDSSGYAMLKSRDQQKHLILKYGPHGGGHGHPDKLALELWGYGQRLSPDLGTPGYGIAMRRSWYGHTLAHNTLLLDGENQPPVTGRLLKFAPPGGAFAVADADVSWSDDGPYQGVHFRRAILWQDRYFIDIVRVVCPQPRQIDLAWHHSGTLEMDGLAASDITFNQPGYQHLTNIRQTEAGEWRALWRTAAGPGTQVWALNPATTRTLVADAPYNPASETMPLVIRRVDSAQAVFVSVVESFATQPVIENVTWTMNAAGVSIQVDGDGIADGWQIVLADSGQPPVLPGGDALYVYEMR